MPTATETRIQLLFTAIDARTAAMTPATARSFLNTQIEAWEERERRFLAWCQHRRGVNPLPGLDAFQVAGIILDLFARREAISRKQAA